MYKIVAMVGLISTMSLFSIHCTYSLFFPPIFLPFLVLIEHFYNSILSSLLEYELYFFLKILIVTLNLQYTLLVNVSPLSNTMIPHHM